jgi:hypothetical protein
VPTVNLDLSDPASSSMLKLVLGHWMVMIPKSSFDDFAIVSGEPFETLNKVRMTGLWRFPVI